MSKSIYAVQPSGCVLPRDRLKYGADETEVTTSTYPLFFCDSEPLNNQAVFLSAKMNLMGSEQPKTRTAMVSLTQMITAPTGSTRSVLWITEYSQTWIAMASVTHVTPAPMMPTRMPAPASLTPPIWIMMGYRMPRIIAQVFLTQIRRMRTGIRAVMSVIHAQRGRPSPLRFTPSNKRNETRRHGSGA